MTASLPSTFRLIFWPTVITCAVGALRLWLEVQGSVTAATGGRLHPLGITWLAFVFGGYFGWRLRRGGSAPGLRKAPLWALLAMIGVVAAVMINFSQIDPTDRSQAGYEALRGAVRNIILIAIALALLTVAIWRRLAWTLFCYGLLVRLFVVAQTWLAKSQGWDTHYTKFGPSGIERPMAETMSSASFAQLGFWVAFTMVAGGLVGCVAGALARRR